ncbi:MAG: protein kinase domain-containing protein [Planctomycetales bacterium]
MTKCPHCQFEFAASAGQPTECPQCRRKLPPVGQQTLADDSAEWGAADESKTMQFSVGDGSENSQTVQSDEFSWNADLPAEPGPGTPAAPTGGSREFDVSVVNRTAEFESPIAPGPSGPPSAQSGGESATVESDEFDPADLDRTFQSEEFAILPDPAAQDASHVNRTVAFEESPAANDDRTIQADEFRLSDVDPGSQQTMMSDEFQLAEADKTMALGGMPEDKIKTMQTMWSGAFQGPNSPGMTIKGAGEGTAEGGSSLVIKQRQLSNPGEKPTGSNQAEYELIRVLGEGGMGVVYDARQTSVDRSVAVKMLKPRTSSDERQRQKFLAEAVVTGDLDHPNIVPIYDVGTSERGLLFYAMKKVKGTPWMKLLPEQSQAVNLEILMKVADAVGFAHARGVIHRDLKPENVMLGDFGEVLVMDWGLALPAAGFAKTNSISPSHSMGGTPAYMAPEMASGPLEKISFASDVYLLGAILFEILTGRPPHTGKNTMHCLFAAAKNDIRQTDKTGELMDIARRAMATEPADRFATVRDFQEAIRDYLSHAESIALSTRAVDELRKAQDSDDYKDYARSLFAFEEALGLWKENARARAGLVEVRLKYAGSAYQKGDYDLGASLLDPSDATHTGLLQKLQTAQRDRAARQQRMQSLKRVAASMVALFVISVTVAFFWIRAARDEAIVAQKQEEAAKQDAVQQREEAVDQRRKADAAREQEEVARKDAEDQKEIALQQKRRADLAREEEEEAKKDALSQKVRAELAQEKEKYQAYIARIGLASAKIDDNAFDSARQILRECAESTPELLNWEWGRLMHLCQQSVLAIPAEAPLDAVDFSNDGARFVTGGWDRSATVRDATTGDRVLTIPHQGLYVHAVAYSPAGDLIATGSSDRDGFLRVCDAATGQVVRLFQGHRDGVLSVAFSRDGKRLLSAGYDRTARLWDVATGNELQVFQGHTWWVWSAAFSTDQTQIVTASQDGSAIVWSVETGEQKGQFLGHRGPVFAAAWGPEGRVATGGYDNTIRIWRAGDLRQFDYRRLAKGEEIKQQLPPCATLEGHTAAVRSVRFSADGKRLVSAGHDNTVRLWDVSEGELETTIRGHGSWVRAAVFSPDAQRILSVGHDQQARLWKINNYEETRTLKGRVLRGHVDAVLSAAFSRDGEAIVTASRDHTARTWNALTGEMMQRFEEGHSFLASSASFSGDGKRLATSAVDNTVRIWDVSTGTETLRIDHTGRSAALAFAPDGRWLLTGSDDKVDPAGLAKGALRRRTGRVWDALTGQLLHTLEGHAQEVTAVAVSPSGGLLYTGDAHGVGMLWEAATGKLRHKLKSHTRKISAAAFLEEERLLTASQDKTVSQWDTASGQEDSARLLKHPEPVLSLAVVPGARRALTTAADGLVRLWDLDQPRMIDTLPVQGEVNSVAVTGDGRQALTVHADDRTVRLWDLQTLREIVVPGRSGRAGPFLDFREGGGLLWTAAFTPDGEGVLTVGGTDARLWDRQQAGERISFNPNGILASARFSPDGERIVTGSWDGSARVWNARTGKAELKLTHPNASHVNSAVYSPDGAWILTACDDGTAVLWDAKSGEISGEPFAGHTGRVHSAVFSSDGSQVLTASADKSARLWDVATRRETGKFGSAENPEAGHQWAVLSAAFSANGRKVVTGSQDNTAIVWDVATQKPLLPPLRGHTAPVSSVAFLPDDRGSRIITGSADNMAKLWDGETGKEILTLKGHGQEITTVGVSTSGQYLLTGSRDGTAVIWLAVDWKQPPQAPVARRDPAVLPRQAAVQGVPEQP